MIGTAVIATAVIGTAVIGTAVIGTAVIGTAVNWTAVIATAVDWNSGDWNSGNRNSGLCNSGDWNSGDWNSGDWKTAVIGTKLPKPWVVLNTQSQKLKFFDKETDMTFDQWQNSDARYLLNQIDFRPADWIWTDDMTDAEKAEHPDHETTGGY